MGILEFCMEALALLQALSQPSWSCTGASPEMAFVPNWASRATVSTAGRRVLPSGKHRIAQHPVSFSRHFLQELVYESLPQSEYISVHQSKVNL